MTTGMIGATGECPKASKKPDINLSISLETAHRINDRLAKFMEEQEKMMVLLGVSTPPEVDASHKEREADGSVEVLFNLLNHAEIKVNRLSGRHSSIAEKLS